MCGILGYISIRSVLNDGIIQRCQQSLTRLSHRGPDASGEFYDQSVYFGHRRLSIIDLSVSSNQPFHSLKKNGVITFNGEIYNYKELSTKLNGLRTSSDTEVILEGYLKFGISFFHSLRGMYAFAIYDLVNNKVVLYRDPSGIKPLYYSDVSDFVFASEIKSIIPLLKNRPTINEPVLKSYLALGYCLEPYSIYSEIQAVHPGDCLEIFVSTGKIVKHRIRKFDFTHSNDFKKAHNYEVLNEKLDVAIDRNLVSDVPVNFALSGGIDSSLLFAKGHRSDNTAISVKFNDSAYDETSVAQIYARHLQANLKIVLAEKSISNFELLNSILVHMDQPYADSSAVPFFMLAKEASKISKVLIGGDGGDEIQNGYPAFRVLPWLQQLGKLGSIRSALRMILNYLPAETSRKVSRSLAVSEGKNWDAMLCEWQSWFPATTKFNGKSPFLFEPDDIYQAYSSSFKDIKAESFQQKITKDLYYKRMLSDYLRKSDMMSMMISLEYRVPMLDEDLVELSLGIPYNQKSNQRAGKVLFRQLHATLYPASTSRLPKSGFSIPLDTWLAAEDILAMHNLILREDGIVCNYIDKNYIDFLFKAVGSSSYRKEISRASAYQRILILYSLQYWFFNRNN